MGLNIKELRIGSPAFTNLAPIPKRYTVDGENISPPLEWSGLPSGTLQLALICHDPDAPLPQGFTHWTLYNISPSVTRLAEAGGSKFTEGLNSVGQLGYTGPAPPKGHGLHHYYFWLYALNKELNLKPGLNREQLLKAIADRIVEQARLVGVYER
jgi:hypothetical protein